MPDLVSRRLCYGLVIAEEDMTKSERDGIRNYAAPLRGISNNITLSPRSAPELPVMTAFM
jgi:hypothetical protein